MAGTVHPSSVVVTEDGWASIVIFVCVAVGLSVALAWVLVTVNRRRLVIGTSVALKQLDLLNARSRTLVPILPPIRLSFDRSVGSKGKFDRADLVSLMSGSILEREPWVEREIEVRLASTGEFERYHRHFEALAHELLGRGSHSRVSDQRFAAIEQKLFQRRKLAYPTPTARITTTVRYTSPKGQNSYSSKLEWDFDKLRLGLQIAQAARTRQSTAEAWRQRERSLMSASLRTTILRRDGSRCRMCGTSPFDGASLHIDHITPVSWGGLTVPENLQTLCQSCNLGKGNKFIG